MFDLDTSRRGFLRNCGTAALTWFVAPLNNPGRERLEVADRYLESCEQEGLKPNDATLKNLSRADFSTGESGWDLGKATAAFGGDQVLSKKETNMIEDAYHIFKEIGRLGDKPSLEAKDALARRELIIDGHVSRDAVLLKERGWRKKIPNELKPYIRLLQSLGVGTAYAGYEYFFGDSADKLKTQIDFINKSSGINNEAKQTMVNRLQSLDRTNRSGSAAHNGFALALIALSINEYSNKLPRFMNNVQRELSYAAQEYFRANNELEINLPKHNDINLASLIPLEMAKSSFNKQIVLTLTPRAETDATNLFYHKERMGPVFYYSAQEIKKHGFSREKAEQLKGFYFGYDKTLYPLGLGFVSRHFKTAKFTLEDRKGNDDDPPVAPGDPNPGLRLPLGYKIAKKGEIPVILVS